MTEEIKSVPLDAKNRKGWVDLGSELYRVYDFGDGVTVRIERPLRLLVSESGGHRILDQDGISHYIPFKWIHLWWKTREGNPKFVA